MKNVTVKSYRFNKNHSANVAGFIMPLHRCIQALGSSFIGQPKQWLPQ